MSQGMARALQALRDVAGVQGSFALHSSGELVCKDLPTVFHAELFVEVGARLSRFVETLATDGDEVSSAMLRFDVHSVHVTRFAHGLLAVVTDSEVNNAALAMAVTLTARRLESEIIALLTARPSAVESAPSPRPPS
ncbi:MAG TPA: roadblock/LC7 domain-containing protein [Polyangiaceae bacterium]|nr:roadblock/LC7 domain-containing protein [Polyangiaceae bacterium]